MNEEDKKLNSALSAGVTADSSAPEKMTVAIKEYVDLARERDHFKEKYEGIKRVNEQKEQRKKDFGDFIIRMLLNGIFTMIIGFISLIVGAIFSETIIKPLLSLIK
jgi:hypothetical protein